MNNDLFSSNFTSGDMGSIDFISGWIGKAAVVVISIVGFGIVMAAIMKNAVHGLYAVNPKLWDKVDTVKKAAVDRAKSIGGDNKAAKVLGSITAVLLSLLPNVKAMTDFDDEPMDAKMYFMKAIPLMCVQIFIGVFIFFGYPSLVAQKMSDFGTGMFDVVLTNVDPQAWVEALPDKIAFYKFSTDGAQDDISTYQNKIARSATEAVIGSMKEMTKESRIKVALEVESQVIVQTTSASEGSNMAATDLMKSNEYSMAVVSRIIYNAASRDDAQLDLSRVDKGLNENGVATFAYVLPVDTFSHGCNNVMDTTTMWLRYDLTFTPKAMDTGYKSVSAACTASSFTTSKNEIQITFGSASSSCHLSGNGRATGHVTVNGKTVEVTAGKNDISNGSITFRATNSTDLTGVKEVFDISGLKYAYESNGHPITSITQGSGTTKFTSTSEAGVEWLWGEQPGRSGSSSGSTQSSGNTSSGSKSSINN